MAADVSPTTGQQYYRWKTNGHSEKKGYVQCQCECGTVRDVSVSNLVGGRSRSCGCLQKEAARKQGLNSAKHLTGKRFGRLLVIERVGSDKNKQALWLCRCDCGVEKSLNTNVLEMGTTQSCGCLRSDLARERRFNPDITDEERALSRNRDLDPRNVEWRTEVYERDEFMCQHCGDANGGNLVAHHKNAFTAFPDDRHSVDNGVTLCEVCHKRFHELYGGRDNTVEQWEDFSGGVIPIRRVRVKRKEYDISGKTFGFLKVLRRDGIAKDNHVLYRCLCVCGKESVVSGSSLKKGEARSCGCKKKELIRLAKFDDLTGRRFGKLRVLGLDEADEGRTKWVCVCDCENYRTVHRTQLIQGKVLDCQSQKNDNICDFRSA